MKTRRHISNLKHIAKQSDPGFIEAARAAGAIHGTGDREEIELTHEQFHALLKKHNSRYMPGRAGTPLPAARKSRGAKTIDPNWFPFGNWAHALALPIARRLKLSCIDPVTGHLRNFSPCAIRRKNWNALGLKLTKILNS